MNLPGMDVSNVTNWEVFKVDTTPEPQAKRKICYRQWKWELHMNIASFEIPEGIWLDIPADYARVRPGGAVRLLNESIGEGLQVRWDDSEIQFLSKSGSFAYQRKLVRAFHMRQAKMMRWRMCVLYAQVYDKFVVILSSDVKDEALFNGLMNRMIEAGVPFGLKEKMADENPRS